MNQSLPSAPASETCWYACYTRARHEKLVARLLVRSGYEAYLPLLKEQRQWSDRVKTVESPVFPGYVFARFGLRSLSAVVGLPGIVTVVGQGHHPTPIAESDIEQLRRVLQGVEAGDDPHPAGCWVEEGEEVMVVRGPFRGIRGVVVQLRRRTHVVVRLGAIRRGLAVQVRRQDLRKLA